MLPHRLGDGPQSQDFRELARILDGPVFGAKRENCPDLLGTDARELQELRGIRLIDPHFVRHGRLLYDTKGPYRSEQGGEVSEAPKVSANGPAVKYLADRYRSALVADSGKDGGQRRQHFLQAPPNAGDVLVGLLRDLAARHLSDELVTGGRHQQRRVDLELQRVDAPGPGLAERGHDVAPRVAADVLVHLEAVARAYPRHRRRELGGARRIVAGADDDLMVFHPPRAPGVAVEQQHVAVSAMELVEQPLQRRVVGIVERP